MNILSFLKLLIVASLYLPACSSSCVDILGEKDCRKTLGCGWEKEASPQLCLQCVQLETKKGPCNRRPGCQWDGTGFCVSAECSKYDLTVKENWLDKKRKRKIRRARKKCKRLTECGWARRLTEPRGGICSEKSSAPSGAPAGTSGL